ncbi:MAG: hypothetical protein NVS2B16_21920 [Chloroflexota bacterium]
MRRLFLTVMLALVMGVGASVPRSTLVLASGPSHPPTAQKKCKAVVAKGKSHRKCAKVQKAVTTYTVNGVVPEGFMAVDSHGNIYVTSDPYPLVKFSSTGQVLAHWDGLRFNQDRPDSTAGIALDGQGNVYVADIDADRIVKLSSDLQVLAQWGSYGIAPGQFVAPAGLTLDAQGNIYVVDQGNARIQKLSPTGQVLAVWGKPGDFYRPNGITVDQQNYIYVADSERGRIVKLSPTGEQVAAWTNGNPIAFSFPFDASVDTHGNIFVSDPGNQTIIKLSQSGKQLAFWLTDTDSLFNVLGLARDRQGSLYASECLRQFDPQTASVCRVVKVSATGKPLVIWKAGAKFSPPPGTKVDVGGYSLYIHCTGQGSPTVIMDAGYSNDSGSWWHIQPKIARSTRVCSYDRAGRGYSDPRPTGTQRDGTQIVKELHTLLMKAHIDGPYVLIGHSMGGMNMRLFAYTYPHDIAGMVLIDPSHEDQCVRDVNYCFGRLNAEDVDVDAIMAQLRAATHGTIKGSLGSIPLEVLTQGPRPDSCEAQCAEDARIWHDLQNELASASTNSVHVIAIRSGHFIHFDQPALVLVAINQVLEAVKRPSHALPACDKAWDAFDGRCAQ